MKEMSEAEKTFYLHPQTKGVSTRQFYTEDSVFKSQVPRFNDKNPRNKRR